MHTLPRRASGLFRLSVFAAITAAMCALAGAGCTKKPTPKVGPWDDKQNVEKGGDPDKKPNEVAGNTGDVPDLPKDLAIGKPVAPQEDDPPAGRDLVAIKRASWEDDAEVQALAFSAEGVILAAVRKDQTIAFWDVKTGKRVGVVKLSAEPGNPTFSPDGSEFACSTWSAFDGKAIYLWNLRTGKPHQALVDPDAKKGIGHVTGIFFTPDGNSIVAPSSDGAIHIWDRKKGVIARTFSEPAAAEILSPPAVALSADGKKCAYMNKKDELLIVDPATGDIQQRRKVEKASTLVFSPDGKYVFASRGKSVERINLDNDKGDAHIFPTSAEARRLVTTPSGKSVIVAGEYSDLDILNAATGTLRFHTERGLLRSTRGFDLARDGKTFAVASRKEIEIWTIETGPFERRILFDHEIGDNRIWGIAGDRAGKYLAVATSNGTIVYDGATGKIQHMLKDVRCDMLAMDPTGKFLAIRADRDPVDIYDIEKRTRRPTDAFVPASVTVIGIEGRELQHLTFSPDGKTLAGGEGRVLALWRDGKVQRLSEHRKNILVVAYSSDGKWLASAGQDGKAIVWDVSNAEKPVKKWDFDSHEKSVEHIALSVDGTLLASAGGKDDMTVAIWDLNAGKEKLRWTIDLAKSEGIHGVAFSPDGKYLAVSQGMTDIAIYETTSGKLHALAPGHYGSLVGAGEQLRDLGSGRFASFESTHKRQVLLWNWDLLLKASLTTRPPRPVEPTLAMGFTTLLSNHGGIVTKGVKSLRVAPHGMHVALVAEKEIYVIDAATGKELYKFEPHKERITDVIFSPDSKTLVTCSDDKQIKMWNVADGKLQKTLTEHTAPVARLSFVKQGNILVSSAGFQDDGEIIFWNMPTGFVRHKLKGPDKIARAFATTPDGESLFAVRANKADQWDAINGTVVKSFDVGENTNQLAVSANGKVLAVAEYEHGWTGKPGRLSIWDIASGKLIKAIEDLGTTERLAFGPDGNSLYTFGTVRGGMSNTQFAVWDLSTGKIRLALRRLHEHKNELFGTQDGISSFELPAGDRKKLVTYSYLDDSLKTWSVPDLYNLPLQEKMSVILAHGGKGELKDGTLYITAAIHGRLSAKILDAIPGLPYPVSLKLVDSVNMNDNDLARMKSAKNLKHLDLIGASYLSDAGLKHVGQFAGLETLKFDAPRVTDAGLDHLHKLSALKEVHHYGSASPEAVEKLKKAIPGVKVLE